MVVLVVQNPSIAIHELERDPPAATDGDRPAPFHVSLQGVKAKSGNVHIVDVTRGTQGSKLKAQALRVAGMYAGDIARLEEFAQPFVAERLDHAPVISCCASRNNSTSQGNSQALNHSSRVTHSTSSSLVTPAMTLFLPSSNIARMQVWHDATVRIRVYLHGSGSAELR